MNRKITLIGALTLLAAIALALSACGGGSSPEAVAGSFIKAMAAMDFDKAAKLSTDEGSAALKMLGSFTESMGKEEKAEFGADYTGSVSKVEVNGDSAVAYYRPKGSDEDKTLNLVKVDGKWKVDFQKDM